MMYTTEFVLPLHIGTLKKVLVLDMTPSQLTEAFAIGCGIGFGINFGPVLIGFLKRSVETVNTETKVTSIIRRHWVQLLELDVDDLLPYLYQEKVVTLDNYEWMMNSTRWPRRKEKMEYLLMSLSRRSEIEFNVFLEAINLVERSDAHDLHRILGADM